MLLSALLMSVMEVVPSTQLDNLLETSTCLGSLCRLVCGQKKQMMMLVADYSNDTAGIGLCCPINDATFFT